MSAPENFSEPNNPADEAMDPSQKPMGFFEHLDELRGTLIKCAVVYVIFAVLIGVFLKEFNDLLLWPLDHVKKDFPKLVLDLNTASIMESYTVVIQLCCLGALAPSTPFFFFFLGQFVGPALTKKEKRLVVPVSLVGLVLFAIGAAFGFFLLMTATISSSAQLNEYFGFTPRWTPASYYGLLSWLVIGVGAAFEFPLVIVLLVYMRMMTTAFLKKYRRHSIVAIFIISAVVTPTPDPFTQTMFAAPLYLLFELAILAGGYIEKGRARELEITG